MPTPRWRGNHGPSTCSALESTVKQYPMPHKQHRCILGAVWGDNDGGIEISSWDPSAGKTCGNSTCYVLVIITRTNACQTTSIFRLRRPYSGSTGGQKMASGGKFSPIASRLLMVTIGGQECRKPLRRGLGGSNGLQASFCSPVEKLTSGISTLPGAAAGGARVPPALGGAPGGRGGARAVPEAARGRRARPKGVPEGHPKLREIFSFGFHGRQQGCKSGSATHRPVFSAVKVRISISRNGLLDGRRWGSSLSLKPPYE